ncbi:helix-turn-helix domain-containing protein [Streptomyces sp. WMMB303]|uniref:helix-turn-helix domain-containing protein n=1 Tax=Streptomyces sp. WMMB303 TaxID=3034154 RepID=UPI0023ED8D70|nr:helix-turn-helix domain-containing protein [Streptomyces sp. WMMB303]MDF4253645.1 helix-turn-helix domain-containing protein [Streptomyces sp. WMMB303]
MPHSRSGPTDSPGPPDPTDAQPSRAAAAPGAAAGSGASEASMADLRVLAHPLRLRLLSLLTGEAYSAAEAARTLDQSQANVSYHLRRLHKAGLVDAVGEVAVRGGTAKRYRHDPDSGDRLGRGMSQGVDAYLALAGALGEELRRRTAQRDTGVRGEMTDAEVWLEPEVWAGVRERAREVGDELHRCALPPGTDGAVRVSATMVLFAMRAGEGTPPTEPAG